MTVPGPPASVLSAILRASPAYPYDPADPRQRRMAWFSPENEPTLPSLITDGVSLPQNAYLDANIIISGYAASQGWGTQGVTEVSANYVTTASDAAVLADATAGALTVALGDPTQTGWISPGQRVTVVKTDSSANDVTVTGSAGQTIGGQTSLTLTNTGGYTSVIFDGHNWQVTAGYTTVGAVPSGTAGGDLGGTYPNPTVTATHLAAPMPTSQGGTGNATGQPSGAAGGDLGGSYPFPSVAALDGVTITGTPTLGQVPMATSGTAMTWKTHPVDWVNAVTEYGADNTGVNDATAAINNATTAASGGGVPLYLQAGTYKISAALNWKIGGLVVIGDGSNSTTISQSAVNTPILQVAGDYQNISGLTLSYAAQQTSAQTSAIAIEFGDDTAGSCFQCWYHDIQILRANTGLAISPAITTVAGMFSCLLQDIAIGFYSYSAINLIGGNGTGANCTGCVFTNIYTQNNNTTAANYAVFLEYWDEVTFHQLNIEHVICSTFDALALVSVGNAVIAGLHFEEVTLSADTKALIYMSHPGKTTVYGQTIRFSSFSGATLNSVYRFFDTSCHLITDGLLMDTSNTVTTPAFYMINWNAATASQAFLRSADTTGLTGQQTGAGAGSVIGQYNDTATFGGDTSLAPLTIAPGSLLTSPAPGAVEFDGTAFYTTAAPSSRQLTDAEQFVCLTADYTLANNTNAQSLFNATPAGALAVQSGTTYFFECNVYVTGLSSASHTVDFGFGGTATYTSVLWNSYAGLSAAGATTSAAGTSASATAITGATSGTVLQAIIKGVLRINAGGTVIPQITQVTASAAAVVNAGSNFRAWAAGNGTVAAVGDWS